MNAVVTPSPAPTKMTPMQVFVIGRIEDVQRRDKTTYTRVITPAADAYSRPQTVSFRSTQRLGQKGEEIRQLGTLGGYLRKPFRTTDPETGETTMVTPTEMTLDAVE